MKTWMLLNETILVKYPTIDNDNVTSKEKKKKDLFSNDMSSCQEAISLQSQVIQLTLDLKYVTNSIIQQAKHCRNKSFTCIFHNWSQQAIITQISFKIGVFTSLCKKFKKFLSIMITWVKKLIAVAKHWFGGKNVVSWAYFGRLC